VTQELWLSSSGGVRTVEGGSTTSSSTTAQRASARRETDRVTPGDPTPAATPFAPGWLASWPRQDTYLPTHPPTWFDPLFTDLLQSSSPRALRERKGTDKKYVPNGRYFVSFF
jgi:hypothetical protein